MMRVGAVILVIAALSFWVFPGHTYLQQDSQIYVPILECQFNGCWSGSPEDLVTARPHVNFTFFDELTNGVRAVSRAPLQYVLQGEQLFFRALGFLGIYLIASSFGVNGAWALAVTAICALGSAVKGPEVLTIEYEPTPRAFAVPLLMLAIGLTFRGRYLAAGFVGACAFLLHAPTTWPFWVAYLGLVAVQRRGGAGFLPLIVAAAALVWAGQSQHVSEPQAFFDRLPAQQETLQRMRAAYNYVSTWWTEEMGWYLLYAAVGLAAMRRVKARREHWIVIGGLMATGLLSVPLSWLLLEREKLAIVPQIQPTRALLFVVAFGVLTAGAAGCLALAKRRWWEAGLWLCCTIAFAVQTSGAPARSVETVDLAALADWAHKQPTGMYVFPESGRDRSLGWFRAVAVRPVYVDWKEGGQVNYLREFGYEWWRRWQIAMNRPIDPEKYRELGISYVVFPRPVDWGIPPKFHNKSWYVYGLRKSGAL